MYACNGISFNAQSNSMQYLPIAIFVVVFVCLFVCFGFVLLLPFYWLRHNYVAVLNI